MATLREKKTQSDCACTAPNPPPLFFITHGRSVFAFPIDFDFSRLQHRTWDEKCGGGLDGFGHTGMGTTRAWGRGTDCYYKTQIEKGRGYGQVGETSHALGYESVTARHGLTDFWNDEDPTAAGDGFLG